MRETTRAVAILVALGLAVAAQAQGDKAVQYVPAEKVTATFAKGGSVVDAPQYKVSAGRRDRPGQAEVHVADTDVFHILTGAATFVTGGTLAEAKNTAPEEIRGPSIQGGESRRLSAGDVIVVPHGVPHWFQEVPGPMTYFVVKVRTGGAPK